MKKFFKILVAGLLISATMVGCGTSNDDTTIQQVSGNVVLNGSTSMGNLSDALIEAYSKVNPNVSVSIELTGSNSGIEAVFSALSQIGNVSRELRNADTSNGLVGNVVAIDGIGILVNSANTIDSLTPRELSLIYNGTIDNWSFLGGDDMEIIVVGRDASSGTRSAFEDILGVDCVYTHELESADTVVNLIEVTEGAIGYVSLDSLSNTRAKAVNIDGVSPTTDAISSGRYSFSRPFIMATKGSIDKQTEAVQDFFAFVNSEDGKKIIESVGLVSVD